MQCGVETRTQVCQWELLKKEGMLCQPTGRVRTGQHVDEVTWCAVLLGI